MKINIIGRKVNLKDSFKDRVEKKLSKFDKFFDDNSVATVTVTLEKNRQTVEVTIKQSGYVYRAEETSENMEEALDMVVDLLTRQIRKNKTKIEKRIKNVPAIDTFILSEDDMDEPEETEYNIVRTKKFPVKPMDAEEAILQMNLSGHQFYIFRNMETNEINVVYKRKNGDYGLIEPDND